MWRHRLVLLTSVLLLGSSAAFSGTWYVTRFGAGAQNGTSWANAFSHPQDGVYAASAGDEVWVAYGVYDYSVGSADVILEMLPGISVYGGFGGFEASKAERDLKVYTTTLDGWGYYHVVLGAGNAVLDAFQIAWGNANGDSPDNSGGGMYNSPSCSGLLVTNCNFYNNWAWYYGGAVYNDECPAVFVNCLFADNSSWSGGAVYNYRCNAQFMNCTFADNSASNGEAMYNILCSPTITNCILWDDTGDEIYNSSSTPIVIYSDVRGGYTGTGNIDLNPRFVGAAWGDYHLRSISPCINAGRAAGAPSGDIEGNPRDAQPDMGAYEYCPITVLLPNGGEIWEVGSAHLITWETASDVFNVDISYSTDGGSTWTSIANNVWNSSGGSYMWTLPTVVDSTKCRVRVEETGGGGRADMSNANFTIASIVQVTSPNGGESWDAGSSQTITWNTDGPVIQVDIEYSTDAGSTWSMIVANTANTGTFAWTVVMYPTAQALVRVTAKTDSAASDVSNAVFTIVGVLLVSPNGGEEWGVGTLQTIDWLVGGIPTLHIELSRDGGTSWEDIVASTDATAGSYPWTVTGPLSANCLIRISDASDGDPVDVSDGTFNILAASITLTSPNGGQKWPIDSYKTISWTSVGITTLHIEVSRNGGDSWSDIAASADALAGSYSWRVTGSESDDCLVRVSDVGGTPSDRSNSTFTIVGCKTALHGMRGGCVAGGGSGRAYALLPLLLVSAYVAQRRTRRRTVTCDR